MALDADQLSVLASIAAEGIAGEDGSSEETEAEAPEDGDAADFLSGDISGISAASGAGRATSAVVISDCDHGRSSSRSWGCVHGGGGHGLTVHGGRLTVHL